MAITKQRKIKRIEINYETGNMSIEWTDEILEDGVRLIAIPHRRSFGRNEKEEFKMNIPNKHRANIGAVVDDLDANLPPVT